MNKRPIFSGITLAAVFLTGATLATIMRPNDTVVSSKTAPPTPSIFGAGSPSPRNTVAPRPITPAPTPSPTPPPPTLTPLPPTPTPTPRPQFFTLNLKTTNLDFGTVTVDPQSEDNRYEKDTNVNLDATPKTGFKFEGWTGDVSSSSSSLSLIMESNKRIQGEFTKLRFPLVLNPSPGGTIILAPQGQTFDYGTTITVKAVPDKGYIFKFWTGDTSGTLNPTTITLDRTKTIGAEFVKGEYVLSLKTIGGGFIDAFPPGLHLEGGSVVTLTARPADRSRFESWSGDATSKSRTITVTMDSDKTITANFVRLYTLNVTVTPSGSGTVTQNFGIYDEGTEVTLIATPYAGWQFTQWAGHLNGGSPMITIMMDSDRSVMAAFLPER